MKEIKEKPTERAPKSDSAGKIPKAALKKAWTETKEKSRAKLRESTSAQGDGDYTTANDTGGMVTDTSHSAIQQNTDFTVQQSRKFARKQIEKYRERHTAEQVETSRAYTAGERGVGPKQARRGTLPDAEPRPHRGADLPHQRAKEKVDTAKTAPRDIRGVTQGQRQLRTAANETVRNVTTQAQVQTRTRQVQLAMQKAAANTRKTATAVRSAIRHFLASLRSLVTAIVTGISVALSIIIVISLVAFVSGSAYGIFFAANAPNENAISVQEALETLTGEYRDRLEEISNTIQHDRQDIVTNDGVYFIRWQAVLAVFSSYVSGDEFGSSVASLEEEQVDKLREIMWEIVTKQMYREVQAEIARRNSKSCANRRKQKRGRYNSKYALSERLYCGECGSPYKRVTWNIHGRKEIVWRCVNRVTYGTKFCHNSPSVQEEVLHQTLLRAIQNLADNYTDEVAMQINGILHDLQGGTTELEKLQQKLADSRQEFDRLLDLSLECDASFLDDKVKRVSKEIDGLKKKIEVLTANQQKAADPQYQLSTEDFQIKEYSDALVARIVEKVIVLSVDEIKIEFVGGYTVNTTSQE